MSRVIKYWKIENTGQKYDENSCVCPMIVKLWSVTVRIQDKCNIAFIETDPVEIKRTPGFGAMALQ